MKKFRIIAEYENSSPYVGSGNHDTEESAITNAEMFINSARRVWVEEVYVRDADTYATPRMAVLVGQDGFGVGPLAIQEA